MPHARLHKLSRPIILGLTGGLGMGKSTVARQFARLGAAVYDADKVVHKLLAPGGAAESAVKKLFPKVMRNGAIDRKKLGAIVFHDKKALGQLEKIIHPLVRKEEQRFVRQAYAKGYDVVVLEIPLLFETGAQKRCDKVAVVTAPPEIQRQRAIARKGMTAEKFQAILSLQMPDRKKRQRADFIIPTGMGKAHSLRHVKKIMSDLRRN